jgi:soluble lytic murein transglycosylase-like protein
MRRAACIYLLLMCCALCSANAQSEARTSPFIKRYAAHYNVPPKLIAAFIDVESRWNPRAVSNEGAVGLMQLMPATAQRFGARDPFDPEQNIAARTRCLTTLMWEFHGDMRLIAAAYYAGDRGVAKKQLGYRNPDVVAYVESVRRHYLQRMSSAASLPGGQPLSGRSVLCRWRYSFRFHRSQPIPALWHGLRP